MFKDILLGILWAFLVSTLFHFPLTFSWVLLGILFALLPDIDFFVEYFKRGTVGGKTLGAHRMLTHIPLLFVPLGLILFFLFGSAVTLLFALGIIGHFLHDSRGMGYGYRFFYPFDKHFYKFFSDSEGHVSYAARDFLRRWSESEVRTLHQRFGNDNWIRDDWKWHKKHLPALLLKLLAFCAILACLSLLFKALPL
ncbi:MAG: metal-dependent hydrolase [Candidatus Moraniibacteriota bacterium]